jgi:peptidyl-prolyl cis-trans isomerase A (cyclophilin A)
MTLRIAALALVALAAIAPAMPVPPEPGQRPVREMIVEEQIKVALDTDKGRIIIALDRGRAPVTVDNFLAYVDQGWLTGQPFYRAMPYGDGGLIQGGVRDGAKLLPPIQHEPTSVTGLRNVAGSVAMASLGPGTARSDFFIMTTDIPAFDASPTDGGFAVFGRVVEGMDVVKAILAAPTSPTKGESVMRGQMLEPEVRIVKAARVKA